MINLVESVILCLTAIMAKNVLSIIRARDWWDYKLPNILAVSYATALLTGRSLFDLAPQLLLLLAAISIQASYVSVINDATDINEDTVVGKANQLADRSVFFRSTAVTISIALGFLVSLAWRSDPAMLAIYACGSVSFTLYSLPPFRLKTRGFSGVIADGVGAHLFPSLLAVAIVTRSIHSTPNTPWLIAVMVWALAYGLRGNLWHQLFDRDADIEAGVNTYVARTSKENATRLGTLVIFPIELLGLSAILIQLSNPFPAIALLIHALLVWRRQSAWKRHPTVVSSSADFEIVLHEYYDVLFPISLLIAATYKHPTDVMILTMHLLLFRKRLAETIRAISILIWWPIWARIGIRDRSW